MPALVRRAALVLAFALFACRGEPKLQRVTVEVSGMTCESCVQAIEHGVGKLEGVSSCEVDLEGGKATVVVREGVEPGEIVAAIEKLGYEAEVGGVEVVADPG